MTTYRLGLDIEFRADDCAELLKVLRNIAGYLEEEGYRSCPVTYKGERIGHIVAEVSG